jgi:hypothetical protein
MGAKLSAGIEETLKNIEKNILENMKNFSQNSPNFKLDVIMTDRVPLTQGGKAKLIESHISQREQD